MELLIRINLMKGCVNIKTEWNSFRRLLKGMVLGTNADKKNRNSCLAITIFQDVSSKGEPVRLS